MRPVTSAASLSPPSTTSPLGLTNSASLPIARSSNPAWDKPERARTSHACEPCRERKTKCDGSRPACRRCLHTGTTCFYGYGKGWRKRKTAEDLTATSRRLARYEILLNDIFPMVSPEVRALIEDARENDTSNGGSEANEMDYGFAPPRPEASLTGDPGNRIILPLPVPSPHVPPVSRSSTSSGTYEPLPGPTVRPLPAAIGGASVGASIQPSQRLSPDSNAPTRLPSITAGGILIESEPKDRSPPLGQAPMDVVGSYGQDRMGLLPTSPTNPMALGEMPRAQQFSPD